ncbi:MAG: hypothetical protein RLZZ227_567 [Pseudomonadota bacterium]
MKAPQARHLTALSLLTLALPIALTSPAILAQDAGWYGGVSLGKTHTDIQSSSLRSALQAARYTVTNLDVDDNDAGWKVLGGYHFNQNYAVEATYADLGNFDAHATLLPAAFQRGKASVHGYGVDLVATVPLTDRFSAFGRVGINNLRISQSFSNSAIGAYFADRDDRGMHEKYGAGLEYTFSKALQLRAELEHYRIDDNRVIDDHIGMLSIGLTYRFGARDAVVAPAVVAAPRAAPAPAPAPAPVTITLAASTLFDFDRSELKPDGRAELDKLVRDLNGLSYEVIIVTGHTDRIGTREYNLGLSQRRAKTVTDYLVAAGIPGTAITARGVNSDDPVTTSQQCTGPVNAALKACLQPDRRVEVEVSGTRDTQ